MRKLAIINRLSYRTKEKIYAKSLINKIEKGLDSDVTFTEYPGHAERIAKDSSGYGLIIAGGGDGTISEVVNGMELENQALAILPLGTGNSLAHDLGISTLATAFDVIKQGEEEKIDLLHCKFENGKMTHDRYAVTTSGIGFASEVARFGNRYLKMAGPFCYPLSACLKPFKQEVISAEIKIDNSTSEEIKFTNCFINNTGYAGNTCVFPYADLCDSMLNLLFVRTNALTQYIWNISVITKTYFYRPGQKAANKLHIKLHRPSVFMLDGEIFDSVKEIKYSVIPRALNVLT